MPSNGKSWNYPSKIPFSQVLKRSAFLEAGIRISQLCFWDFGKEKPPRSIVAQSNLFRSCTSRFSSQSLCWESLFGRRKKGRLSLWNNGLGKDRNFPCPLKNDGEETGNESCGCHQPQARLITNLERRESFP